MIDSMPNDEQTRKVRFMFSEDEVYTKQTAKEGWHMKDIENCVLRNSGSKNEILVSFKDNMICVSKIVLFSNFQVRPNAV